MLSNQFRTQIAIATLALFIISCGSSSLEVTTENSDNAETIMEEGVKTEMENTGSISIAELVDNAASYEGKTVQISGTCTKINTGIMGLNWIHLKDGSKDDFDLVVTTDGTVPVGNAVTMSGVVALNKDFGYGYSYELIVEEGKILE